MSSEKEIKVGLGAVVINKTYKGKICLVEELTEDKSYGKERGMLTIPMGTINSEEFIEDAIIREVYEETGHKVVELKGIIGIYQIRGALGVVYLVEVEGEQDPDWEISSEIKMVVWSDPKLFERENIRTRPAVREIISDFQAGKLFPLGLIKDNR